MPGTFDSNRPLAFMHVPKTAGTSLIAGLFDAVQPQRYVTGFDKVLFGDFEHFASFARATRDVIYLQPDSLPPADLITGHIALSTLRARYANAHVVTLLREPLSRLLSHWLFWRGHEDKHLEDWGEWGDRVRLSRLPLAGFLKSRLLACQNDNLLARMLLWPHRLIPAGDFIDSRNDGQLLDEAQARLASLDFVGFVEDPDLPAKFQAWLGRPFVSQRKNETGDLPSSLQGKLDAELTSETFDLLDSHSRIDVHLWRHCVAANRPESGSKRCQARMFTRSVARYALLMAGK